MAILISLDGRDVPLEAATVPVLDRGFLFGDSVYEVIRTYDRLPFQLAGHLDRLAASARIIGFPFEPDRRLIEREVDRLLARWNEDPARGEAQVRIVVTRGSGEALIDPRDATGPRTIVLVRALHAPDPAAYDSGVRAAVVAVRRNLITALPPAAKTGNYLNNLLALIEAQALGADEPILLDVSGRVTESATSNVFVVRGRDLLTPGADVGILGGLTRRAVLALAPSAGYEAREAELLPSHLRCADEILLTSTTREIVPVTRLRLDGEWLEVGSGRAGRAARTLLEGYRRWARENRA